MRTLNRVCIAFAVCCLCAFGWPAPGFAQVPAFPGEAGPLVPADVAPFQSRLNRVAEAYRVQPVASGNIFSSSSRDIFLFRLGEGEDCSKQKKCVYVMFRDAQDDYPFVTFCAPGHFELAHAHTANGQLLHRFEFVCEKAKFQIHLSSHSAFVGSYINLDD